MSSDALHQSETLLAQLCPSGAMRRAEAPYQLIEVRGPDAPDFLHRLCSQQILELEPGVSTKAAFLDSKGKLVGVATICRDGDRVLVEVPSADAESIHEILDRYHFTEKLELQRRTDLVAVEVVGPGACDAAGSADGTAAVGDDSVQLANGRHGVESVRMHGTADAVAVFLPDLPPIEEPRAEALRILALRPRIGVDSNPATLGLEAALDDHVSTTKGCYTGQEIVARIHTYGHVNRKLVRLRIEGTGEVAHDTPIRTVDEQAPLGRVTSAVDLPGAIEGGGRLALGYLPEPFLADPEPIELGDDSGAVVHVLD